jgi:hypothetical protein
MSLAHGTAADLIRSRSDLILENALLCQQLIVLERQVKRPKLTWLWGSKNQSALNNP